MTQPEIPQVATEPEIKKPFRPEIPDSLRDRIDVYAEETGRSATNAVIWFIRMGLKKEGF